MIDSYTYDPFGTIIFHHGNTKQPFRFMGELGVESENSSLYYVRARYYDAANGRFLSKDTYPYSLSNPQTLNRYVYATNNPVLRFDQTGNYQHQDDNREGNKGEIIEKFISTLLDILDKTLDDSKDLKYQLLSNQQVQETIGKIVKNAPFVLTAKELIELYISYKNKDITSQVAIEKGVFVISSSLIGRFFGPYVGIAADFVNPTVAE
ncbi:RHS repeat-associated core domain-containing protein [Mucilaginibacter angelicae]|uniref:RHS repeat-associated core domain-containing protein n=1 Tax=Mucilaginibacter angelicae TaxID=869718 RepID=A0ABV6L591_9SPHI